MDYNDFLMFLYSADWLESSHFSIAQSASQTDGSRQSHRQRILKHSEPQYPCRRHASLSALRLVATVHGSHFCSLRVSSGGFWYALFDFCHLPPTTSVKLQRATNGILSRDSHMSFCELAPSIPDHQRCGRWSVLWTLCHLCD